MAKSDVSAVVNYFPTVNEGFSAALGSGGVLSGGTAVPLTTTSGLTDGSIFVGIIEPGQANQQVFTGTVDTGGIQITGVKWTRGTNVDHLAGVTIVDYVTGTWHNMVTTGILKFANQAGTLKTSAVQAALGSGTEALNGWNALGYAPNTITYNGNRSYNVVINTTNVTGTISAGMRLRTTRTANAPTQSTSLNGTTQYYSKSSPSGMTFTDDFTVSAWIKVSSYPTGTTAGPIASRIDGTQGWWFGVSSDGKILLSGHNAALANYSRVLSYQAVPLNRWVHVTAQLDMSAFTATTTTSYVMFDGVDVPAQVVRAGTSPTALVQAGNLNIGTYGAGSDFYPGKIAQVAIYNAKVTQATIKASISQGLVGTETSLISAYSFNNVITDLNANANNLTANGSAVATNADSPFGGQGDGTISATLDYAIVQSSTYSTNTTLVVQVPEGCTIPTTGGVSTIVYSSQKIPYLFPAQEDKWELVTYVKAQIISSAFGAVNTWTTTALTTALVAPIGAWRVGYKGSFMHQSSVNAQMSGFVLLADSTPTGGYYYYDLLWRAYQGVNTTIQLNHIEMSKPVSYSVATNLVLYGAIDTSSGGTQTWQLRGDQGMVTIYARNTYL